jgi:hypothetical protein
MLVIAGYGNGWWGVNALEATGGEASRARAVEPGTDGRRWSFQILPMRSAKKMLEKH